MPDDETTSDTRTLKGVEFSFDIIEFVSKHRDVTATVIADHFDRPLSTTHTHLKTLCESGYLVKDEKQYSLSLQFLKQGGRVRHQKALHRIARSEVDKVARKTGELATLGVEEQGQRVLLYKSEGENALYEVDITGEYTHLHWSALGKAILANLPRERIDEIVAQYGLPPRTDDTVTTEAQLHEELTNVRNVGYAIEDEERTEGIRAIGMPITQNDAVPGAIAVSGPSSRITDREIEETIIDKLKKAMNKIEIKLKNRYAHG